MKLVTVLLADRFKRAGGKIEVIRQHGKINLSDILIGLCDRMQRLFDIQCMLEKHLAFAGRKYTIFFSLKDAVSNLRFQFFQHTACGGLRNKQRFSGLCDGLLPGDGQCKNNLFGIHNEQSFSICKQFAVDTLYIGMVT